MITQTAVSRQRYCVARIGERTLGAHQNFGIADYSLGD